MIEREKGFRSVDLKPRNELDSRRTANAEPFGVWWQSTRKARRSHLPARRSVAAGDTPKSHAIGLGVQHLVMPTVNHTPRALKPTRQPLPYRKCM